MRSEPTRRTIGAPSSASSRSSSRSDSGRCRPRAPRPRRRRRRGGSARRRRAGSRRCGRRRRRATGPGVHPDDASRRPSSARADGGEARAAEADDAEVRGDRAASGARVRPAAGSPQTGRRRRGATPRHVAGDRGGRAGPVRARHADRAAALPRGRSRRAAARGARRAARARRRPRAGHAPRRLPRRLFPMPVPRRARRMAWCSPDPRGVVPLDAFHVSRSLRRSLRRYEITVDRAFDAVVEGCADPAARAAGSRPRMRAAYAACTRSAGRTPSRCGTRTARSRAGSTASRSAGLFAAESKFHVRTDASKVAVVALVERLREARRPAPARRAVDDRRTCATLGARDLPRREYLRRLRRRCRLPPALG